MATPGETTWDTPVAGGTVRVAAWGPTEPTQAVVLAIHGITANHTTWQPLAELLPQRRILATDLRGRGHSAGAGGPSSMERHARDLLAVLDAADLREVVVVGHSMGASVAVALRHLAPDRVLHLLLVDGGLPLPAMPGLSPEQAVEHLLGPALERLSMTFAGPEAYRAFWRQHPSFQGRNWSAAAERYVDYDLVEEGGRFRSSVRRDAVVADFLDQLQGPAFLEAHRTLETTQFDFLRAPRGLLNQLPGLYPPDVMPGLVERYPGMRWSDVDNLNHYMILLTPVGSAAVARALEGLRPTIP